MYQFQTRGAPGHKNPFEEMSQPEWQGQPNEHQARLIDAVRKALLAGLFYNTDVHAFVAKEMNDVLNEEILSANSDTMKTELGYFGSDIFYCRQMLETTMRRQANIETTQKLINSGILKVGAKFRNVHYDKKYSTATVSAINTEEGFITFHGKRRGSADSWEFGMGGNDTRFLTAVTNAVTDNTVKVNKGEEITQYIIEPTANRHQELTCQLA